MNNFARKVNIFVIVSTKILCSIVLICLEIERFGPWMDNYGEKGNRGIRQKVFESPAP